MADIKLDTSELRSRARALGSTCSTLRTVSGDAESIACAVGHDGLAGKVREFGNAWTINRDRLIKELEALSQVISAVADTYEDMDRQIASAAQGKEK